MGSVLSGSGPTRTPCYVHRLRGPRVPLNIEITRDFEMFLLKRSRCYQRRSDGLLVARAEEAER